MLPQKHSRKFSAIARCKGLVMRGHTERDGALRCPPHFAPVLADAFQQTDQQLLKWLEGERTPHALWHGHCVQNCRPPCWKFCARGVPTAPNFVCMRIDWGRSGFLCSFNSFTLANCQSSAEAHVVLSGVFANWSVVSMNETFWRRLKWEGPTDKDAKDAGVIGPPETQ